ncbi:hypothetical protein J4526_00605 [Desulfurococcaceae archaeon MEX13E-LK6-19]|nr:hypothetical protein J4526_00605 [Desulfurococcaceae archaeon MEX13E-LK6-19]
MVKVVAVKTGGVATGIIVYIVFMALVVAGLYPLFMGAAGVAGIVLAFIIFTVVSYFFVRKTLLYIVINRIVDKLRDLIIVEGDVIRFKKPVEAEKGVLRYIGVWIGYYRHYHTEYLFKDTGEKSVIEKIDTSKEPLDYLLLLNEDKAGYIEAPGYFITEPGLEGSVIAVLRAPRPGETVFELEKQRLHVAIGKEFGEATIETRENGVKGSLFLYTRRPRNKLRVFLSSIIKLGRGELFVTKKLAETKRERVDFEATLFPSETIVLVGHIKTMSPYNIARALKQLPVIYGAHKGEHWIRLELEASPTKIEKDYTKIKASIKETRQETM